MLGERKEGEREGRSKQQSRSGWASSRWRSPSFTHGGGLKMAGEKVTYSKLTARCLTRNAPNLEK